MLIYKITLAIVDMRTIDLPISAEILHVGEQNGHLCMWYQFIESDPIQTQTTKRHTIEIIGTGNHYYQRPRVHIGTVVMSNGLVWHVFKVTAV